MEGLVWVTSFVVLVTVSSGLYLKRKIRTSSPYDESLASPTSGVEVRLSKLEREVADLKRQSGQNGKS